MYPSAYIHYLTEFHVERDYFECHEILEEYWKKDPPQDRKRYWVGFIQLAVALYHQRRNNFIGAKRLIANSLRILEEEKAAVESLGLDHKELINLLKQTDQKIAAHSPYESIMLPLTDQALIKACQKQGKSKSGQQNDFLTHKHRLRDRTEVLQAREKAKMLRKKSRD
ncbi:DUF309 domain-containing protein [Bacillus sp. CLL-7-23]|uniref:DUF309 domain-containing protein n=1 Tax=Bacillus changyiensis TaxID=3004103 RepID=A0ABT4X662_9BACI|nr:DUF309 domain-containing protein [Bacillus changyiensis]MDA7027763.1 DUF309 domain-containing protein [Bacillus changyiensis]